MNNLMIQNQPNTCSLLRLGADMAVCKDETVVSNLNKAKHFSDKAERILAKDEGEHSVCNAVNSIMTLAMLNDEILHIHVDYSPHIKSIDVRVIQISTDYLLPHYDDLHAETVYLDYTNALDRLKALEDKLIELVADAKDLAMGGC